MSEAADTPVRSGNRLALLAIAAIAAIWVIVEGRALWNEWSSLRAEKDRVRRSAVIGYQGIAPDYSLAEKPSPWFRAEGTADLLFWSGWKEGNGHQWFRVRRGEINPASMSEPIGRDTAVAIDDPIVERGGGTIWSRIPDEADVVGSRLGGIATAYPMLVLDKVFVVNDLIAGRPYLVTATPQRPGKDEVSVYETTLDGHRITMGSTGYFLDGRLLIYDRGTESFWVDQAGGLEAITGVHKGRRLRRLAQPAPVAWGQWRSDHPDSRLVVGSRHSRPRPAL